MAAIQVKPGRARVSLKVWTETLTIDAPGAHMPKEAALVMYQIHVGGALPWADELAEYRKTAEAVENAGSSESLAAFKDRRYLAALALADKVAAQGLLGE